MSIQDDYKAQVLSESALYAYYLMDESSGNLNDSSTNNRDTDSITGASGITYSQSGPFEGSSSIQFVSSTGADHYFLRTGSNTFGDECWATEFWIYIDALSITSGAGGAAVTFLSQHIDIRDNRNFRIGNVGAQGHGAFSNEAIPLDTWTYILVTRTKTTGMYDYYKDATFQDDAAGPFSIPTPTDGPRVGVTFFDAAGTCTIRLSNVAFYYPCPLPVVKFPPPEPFTPQIYRRILG